jgi:hypothetical protein
MSMRWLMTVMAVGSFLLVSDRTRVPAAEAALETLTGEVVDMACYVPHPATSKGSGHRKCADTCLKKGMPMGLVTADKQLYLLLEDHENPKAYGQIKEKAAETISVEGTKVNEGGVQGFVVEALK